jgi:hypothetical protein
MVSYQGKHAVRSIGQLASRTQAPFCCVAASVSAAPLREARAPASMPGCRSSAVAKSRSQACTLGVMSLCQSGGSIATMIVVR